MVELNLGKIKQTDAELEEKIQEIAGSGGSSGGFEILWENPNDTNAFGYQIVDLNKPITDFVFYEVLARFQNDAPQMVSSGKCVVDRSVMVQGLVIGGGIGMRNFSPNSGGDSRKLSINDCYKYSSLTSTSSSKDNTRYVPYMVLGYK